MKGTQPDQQAILAAACKKEGFLGKQARGIIQNYTKRYWMILDNGLTLYYAPSKQDIIESKLKGKIAIKDILSIHDENKPKKFHLICDGRVYKLEATSAEDKKSWIDALNVCIKHAVAHEEKEQKALLAIDDDIIFEDDHDEPEEKSSGKLSSVLQPLNFIGTSFKTVAVDTALKTTVKIFKTGVSTVGNVILGDKLATNNDFLVAKKLKENLDAIDPKILKSRILMGYMFKESKEATGLGLIDDIVNDAGIRDTMSKQWFMLISAKPIVFDDIDPTDEDVLDAGKLPVEFDLETLYGYDQSCDDSIPLEVIPMNNVTDITIKKKGTEDLSYRFVLNLGQKKIHLITDSVFETNAWVKAIQASRATVKEQTKSKLAVVRNIYWHRKIMDEQGEDKLLDKIEKDYEELVQKNENPDLEGLEGLIKLQKVIGEELISIINACLVNKDRRIDIAKTYISCYHENMVSSLRNYFKKNKLEFGNQDCFEFITFLVWYRDLLQMFGPGLTDRRITDGIKILCKIITTRILKTNLDSVQNIIKEEGENQPSTDAKDRLRSNGPQDIFRIVNETFKVLSHCNYKELAIALLDIAKSTLLNYQEGLNYIIEECKLSMNQLGAFCNNTMTYMQNTKEFLEQVGNFGLLDENTISENFDEETINKGFVDVSKKAYETIAEEQFCTLREEWRNKPFLSIDLRLAIEDRLQEVQIVTEKIHNNYITKIELACLEKITAYYIQNFLKNSERRMFRKEDCPKISDKLDEDYNLLKDIFTRTLKPNVVENVITPLHHFHDFLNTNYAFLSESVQKMKQTYGNAIKWTTFDLLIKIRNDEVEGEEKEHLFRSCEEAFREKIHVPRNRERAHTSYNVFKHVNQGSEDADEEEENEDSSFDETSSQDDMRSSRGSMVSSRSLFLKQQEGYLEAEKDEFISVFGDSSANSTAGIKFERLYFNIRKNIMYYFTSKNAENALGSYKLKEVSECAPFENDVTAFYIKYKIKSGEIKRVAFKTDSIERRGLWVSAINEAMTLNTDAIIEVFEGEVQFFKDTKAIFSEIDDPVSTKFEWKIPVAEEEEELPVERRSTIVFRRETRRFTQEEQEEERVGCMAKFCLIFGIGKKKKPQYKPSSKTDYMNISLQHNDAVL